MSIQKIVGISLSILAFCSTGFNIFMYIQISEVDRLYWACLSVLGIVIFLITFRFENLFGKILQILFITIVSALVICYNSESLIGAFFMLGNFALAFNYGFYNRFRIVSIVISASLIFFPLLMHYSDFKRALLNFMAISVVLIVVWLIVRERIQALMSIADKATKLNEKYRLKEGCGDGIK